MSDPLAALSDDTIELAGSVASVNISEEKGTVKQPVDSAAVNELGIDGDAHAGPWHRQVSLLSSMSVARFAHQLGREIAFGEFAENITVAGIDLVKASPLDRLTIGDSVELEVTQIGKKCHGGDCAIFREVGSCVMPHEGLFARVIRGGTVRPGDAIAYEPFRLCCQVITLSDRAASGAYEDRSGPKIEEIFKDHLAATPWRAETRRTVIPDDADQLRSSLEQAVAETIPIVFTTGGTGLGPRDITVDVIAPMLDREIPGIMEFIRNKYGAAKPGALLSRSIAGVIGQTLVFCLPGGQKAVAEYMQEINTVIEHLLFAVRGIDRHG